MSASDSVEVTLGTGALMALERGQGRVRALLQRAVENNIAAFDELAARAVGLLCGRSGHADIVDVHVALVARGRAAIVVTSDPGDIHQVDPSLRLIVV